MARPKDDDLIIPSRRGQNRRATHGRTKFHQDLDRLGLRRRRQHDLRRTFISLSLADGARKDVLRWVTHGPEGDIMDLYTTLPWSALCEEVAKLRVERREGRLITGDFGTVSLQPAKAEQSQLVVAEVHGNRISQLASTLTKTLRVLGLILCTSPHRLIASGHA